VSIGGVHLCYYDAPSAHTFGARVQRVSLASARRGEGARADHPAHILKAVAVDGLALYVDAGDAAGHAPALARPSLRQATPPGGDRALCKNLTPQIGHF